jgi:PRC-barrel domain
VTALRLAAAAVVLASLAACHTGARRSVAPAPSTPVESTAPENGSTASAEADTGERTADMPAVGQESMPPCVPADTKPKPALKRRPKPATQARVEAPVEAPAQAPTPPSGDAQIKPMPVSSVSVLGRKVLGLEGDDMGRVVDVLVDATGHTRIAIIEFGGFLGVGNRRVAVDWSLLTFHTEDPNAPLTLNVNKGLIQSAPDYKDTFARPPVLMKPAPTTEGSK